MERKVLNKDCCWKDFFATLANLNKSNKGAVRDNGFIPVFQAVNLNSLDTP